MTDEATTSATHQPAKIKILFVDDEQKILDGLRRMLRPMSRQWDMTFANSGAEALESLSRNSCDIIVSDIRMPKMTGVELLEEVRRLHPDVIRLVLSGQASRETILRSVGPTHQYLPKPCDADTLRATIERLGEMRDLLKARKIRGLISSMEYLPSLPSLYDEVTCELLQPSPSLSVLCEAVSKDVSMSGKILQLVSSGFFGPPRAVSQPAEAVRILGLDILKPLVLSMHIFSQFRQAHLDCSAMESLWEHSLAAAACARRICECEQADKVAGAAFLAGMLHDVGKIVLAERLPEEYLAILQDVAENGASLLEAERATLGATHAQVGAYLLGIWGLPSAVIQAVAYHHAPADSKDAAEFAALTAVHVADVLAAGQTPLVSAEAEPDEQYLRRLGLGQRLAVWRNACQAVARKEVAHA